MHEIPFSFELPISFFEKAAGEPSKMRRIGGIISTENPDRHGEIILQDGLDLDEFIANGWLNDNHSKATEDILGYPEVVQKYKKGQQLPDGNVAHANGTWMEGYLLNTPKADRIWELGNALQETNRRLGYSVEGGIYKRIGRNKKTIAKAKVRNVAITNCPVNTDSRLDILSKSLQAVQASEDPLDKMLGMGSPSPGSAPSGPVSGMGAGQVLTPESLLRDPKKQKKLFDEEEKKKSLTKSLTDGQAIDWLMAKRPDLSLHAASQLINITKALKKQGRL
jgi:hypothetical protein